MLQTRGAHLASDFVLLRSELLQLQFGGLFLLTQAGGPLLYECESRLHLRTVLRDGALAFLEGGLQFAHLLAADLGRLLVVRDLEVQLLPLASDWKSS